MVVILVVAQLCTLWSLWIRRHTWSSRWEAAATLNVALQGLAVFLMSPYASATIGHKLYALTGQWNLEDYIGHDAYVVAASAIVYNAMGRLESASAMQHNFKQHVERPATLCIPLLLATFTLGNGARIYEPDFFEIPSDFWLGAYWTIFCGILIYLLSYGIKALLIIRQDPRSARVADAYLAACICGIITCIIRLVTALTPASTHAWAIWGFACLCGTIFALMGGYSWLQKARWLRPPTMHGTLGPTTDC